MLPPAVPPLRHAIPLLADATGELAGHVGELSDPVGVSAHNIVVLNSLSGEYAHLTVEYADLSGELAEVMGEQANHLGGPQKTTPPLRPPVPKPLKTSLFARPPVPALDYARTPATNAAVCLVIHAALKSTIVRPERPRGVEAGEVSRKVVPEEDPAVARPRRRPPALNGPIKSRQPTARLPYLSLPTPPRTFVRHRHFRPRLVGSRSCSARVTFAGRGGCHFCPKNSYVILNWVRRINMRHFVAYHKADNRGLLDRTEQCETKSIGSKKSLGMLQAAIGNRVWLFEGRGTTTGAAEFSLAYSFVAEVAQDAAPGEEKHLSGSGVVYFDDGVLNDFPWFKRLKAEMANFSLGFQEVKVPEIITKLEAYLVEADFSTDHIEENSAVFTEGRRRTIEISVRERSASARLACIKHYGTTCFVCGFNFGLFYGKRAEGFIEVHHRNQISESNDTRAVDAVFDLVPLCANCHRVVHLSKPPADVEILKEEIQ